MCGLMHLNALFYRPFQETFSSLRPGFPWTTRLSSAGLVYAHFGEEVLANLLGMPKDSEVVIETFKKVYENFIEEMVSKFHYYVNSSNYFL